MTRRCSHCSNDGHNLRTCPNKGVKVFGVRLDVNQTVPIRKSVSMGNLSQYVGSGGAAAEASNGYASDGFDHRSSLRERKKGTAWTKEEHRQFLQGLEALGKGDWRGIAHMYVPSRTSTQVASHAQKYFNRLNHQSVRRRRASLFDFAPEDLGVARNITTHNQEPESEANVLVAPPPQPQQTNQETNSSTVPNSSAAASNSLAPSYPFYYSPYYYPCYSALVPAPMLLPAPICTSASSVVKPTPIHCTSSTNLNEIVDMSKLNLSDKGNEFTSSVPVNIVGNLNRHSAFHGKNASPIHAV